jgi:hypothetical protein
MELIRPCSGQSRHRDRVLPDTCKLAKKIAEDYRQDQQFTVTMAPNRLRQQFEKKITSDTDMPEHQQYVLRCLATVLSGGGSLNGDADETKEITEKELLSLEHDAFMELIRCKASAHRTYAGARKAA